jgi:D-alanyl-D-alanine dipeptidase
MTSRLKARGDSLLMDDRHVGSGVVRLPGQDEIEIDHTVFSRTALPTPDPAPERWRGLIGAYGWDHNTEYVYEEDGRLHILIEWFFDYPLAEIDENTFVFPNYGLYPDETLVFTRDARGQATQVALKHSTVFERIQQGAADGGTFRINPLQPVDALREQALAAYPPEETGEFREPDLVELTTLEGAIKLDIRYATTNNFMSAVFYDEPRAFMQRPAAEALVRAHRKLNEKGYGLLIHDAYRPWYVTKMFWDATPESQKVFVADPAHGSRHNRGCAVDLTLYDLETGAVIEMPGGYDEFSERSYPGYPGGTYRQRWHRELLREAMEGEGFDVYDAEWWHFDYGDWRQYRVQNLRFEDIGTHD